MVRRHLPDPRRSSPFWRGPRSAPWRRERSRGGRSQTEGRPHPCAAWAYQKELSQSFQSVDPKAKAAGSHNWMPGTSPGHDEAVRAILNRAVIVPCDHPFGTEAPADHLGRGFLSKLVSNFPGFEGHFETSAVLEKRPVMATLPSLFPRGTEAPLPRAGLLDPHPSLERHAPPLPIGERSPTEAPLCGRVRVQESTIEVGFPYNPLPWGEAKSPFPPSRRREPIALLRGTRPTPPKAL